MSSDKRSTDVDRMLNDVFEVEGRARAPERLLEEVFVRTRDQGQARRGPLGGLRMPTIGGRQTPLLVAAVLVIGSLVAIGGVGSRVTPPPTEAPIAQASQSPFPSPAAALCASATGLGGTTPDLWVGCPTGIRSVDVGQDPPVVGSLLENIGVPVAGPAGTWAIAMPGLAEVDPTTGPGRRLDVPGVAVLAVGESTLWGGTLDDTVLRIDPGAGEVTGTIPLGAQPLAIVEAAGKVWVAADDLLLHSYDVDTLAPGPTVPIGSDAARIGANASAVYVVSQGVEGTVTRVDLATGVGTSAVVADPTDPRSLGELLVGDDGVWVTRRTSLIRLDPTTLAAGTTLALPGYPGGLVRDGQFAWTYADPGRLDRIALP